MWLVELGTVQWGATEKLYRKNSLYNGFFASARSVAALREESRDVRESWGGPLMVVVGSGVKGKVGYSSRLGHERSKFLWRQPEREGVENYFFAAPVSLLSVAADSLQVQTLAAPALAFWSASYLPLQEFTHGREGQPCTRFFAKESS